jgi:hypothetical protein
MTSLTPRLDKIDAGQNLIINGAMDFHQRLGANSLTITNTRSFSADRWSHVRSTGYAGTSTAARSTDVPTLAQAGFVFPYSILVTNGTGLGSPAAGDFYQAYVYNIEGNDYAQLHGRPCRLQFWVKSSVVGTYSVSFRNSALDRTYVTTYSVLSANTWEKKSIDLTMDTAGTWLFDNGIGLRVTWTTGGGTNLQTSALNQWQSGSFTSSNTQTNWAGTTGATIQITGVQLVQGSFSANVDLPFRRAGKTIGEELRVCQRYYEKSYAPDVIPGTDTTISQNLTSGNVKSFGVAASATVVRLNDRIYAVNKRSAAVVTFYRATGQINLGDFTQTNPAVSGSFTLTVIRNTTGSFIPATTGASGLTAGSVVECDFHYTAESEL